jgi:hypothetical protein
VNNWLSTPEVKINWLTCSLDILLRSQINETLFASNETLLLASLSNKLSNDIPEGELVQSEVTPVTSLMGVGVAPDIVLVAHDVLASLVRSKLIVWLPSRIVDWFK